MTLSIFSLFICYCCPPICCCAICTRRFVISPPTDPFAREVVSAPSCTPNSCAISVFIWFIACSAPGTTNWFELFLLLFGMIFHLLGTIYHVHVRGESYTFIIGSSC